MDMDTQVAVRPLPLRSSAVRTGYLLFLLSLVTLLNYYDRYLVAILVQHIKLDLHVSDGQIGLLSGAAFGFVYAIMAVPIARYSDRGRRVPVLSASLLIWSLMAGLCGFAQSFPLLLLARLGVGLGEAGGLPTTYAMVADQVTGRWRATALSSIAVLSGIGIMAATAGGGFIADRYGWRAAFWAGAAPGPLLALVLFVTIKQPAVPPRDASARAPALAELIAAMTVLLRRRSFVSLCAGVALTAVAFYGLSSWAPAFLIRQYGLTAGRVGAQYGLIAGATTIVGLLLGGLAGDLLARRDQRWLLWLPCLSFAVTMPFTVLFLTAHNYAIALTLAGPMTFTYMFASSPLPALVQRLAGSQLRATGMATFMLIYTLVGLGLGPWLVGLFSDLLRSAGRGGSNPLEWSLVGISIFYLAGAATLALGARTLSKDIASCV